VPPDVASHNGVAAAPPPFGTYSRAILTGPFFFDFFHQQPQWAKSLRGAVEKKEKVKK